MSDTAKRISTGVLGLDRILLGGFIPQSVYLVRGGSGQGKTTLGLHFLSAVGKRESTLFIGFQESEDQLKRNAESMSIDVSNIQFLNLTLDKYFFTHQQDSNVFFAESNGKQNPLLKQIVETVKRLAPVQIFIDSITQLRFLVADNYQYRKLILCLLHYFRKENITVLLTSEIGTEIPDEDLQSLTDGVIVLDTRTAGAFLQVAKFRGSDFLHGVHQTRIDSHGLEVFPRLLPPKANLAEEERWRWSTGVEKLDKMLYGGLEAGTISLITGPSGVGKSTLASLFAARAVAHGRKVVIYLFEEEISSLLHRASSLKINLKEPFNDGRVSIEQIEPSHCLADEFAMWVNQKVEEEGVELVILDSIAGLELTLNRNEKTKIALHAFVKNLSRRGLSVILINEIESLSEQFRISESGISYLSDNVIFLRYVEVEGELKKSLGVLKKRLSPFDTRMYIYEIGPTTLSIGDSVVKQGALSF